MKDIAEKISSYNLFNYLLPGVIYAVMGQRLGILSLPKADIVVLAFVYYFIGMIVSRVGSLIMEPILKKVKIIVYAPYSDYLKAAEKDQKMAGMVEANNTYRTLAATFLALILGLAITAVADTLSLSGQAREVWLAGLLFVMLVASFRKQSAFIVSRVRHFAD